MVSDAQEKGVEVPPGSDIAWMGAQKPEPPLKQNQGLMQAVSMYLGLESEQLKPWMGPHRLSLGY